MMRPYVKTLGLSALIAGLMALSAGSALAEPGASWLVNGATVTTLLPELAGSLENNHGTLLGTIGITPIHILCTGATFAAGNHLLAEGGWLGKGLFSGCKINTLKEGKVVALPACTPPGDHITTNQLKALIRLHQLFSVAHPIVLIEPTVGTVLVHLPTSEECSFGELLTIHGKVAAKDCENAFLTSRVTHLFEEFPALTALYINGNPASKATLDGSVLVKQAGAHAGLQWLGHPAFA